MGKNYPWNINNNSKLYNCKCPVAEDLWITNIWDYCFALTTIKSDAIKIVEAFTKFGGKHI